MALAVSIRFDFQDSKGKTSFTKIRVPNGFSLSDYIEFAESAAQILANVASARLTRASVCIGMDLSTATIKAGNSPYGDVGEKAFFSFRTTENGFWKRLKLPAFEESYIPPNSRDIDTAAADVLAFIDAMENGLVVTGGTIAPTDARENDIVECVYAYQMFQKK